MSNKRVSKLTEKQKIQQAELQGKTYEGAKTADVQDGSGKNAAPQTAGTTPAVDTATTTTPAGTGPGATASAGSRTTTR